MNDFMVNIKSLIIIFASFLLLFFSACSAVDESQTQNGLSDYTDFIGTDKIIAAQTGTVYNAAAKDLFLAKRVPEYTTMADMLEDLRLGRVDAIITHYGFASQIRDSGTHPEFDYLVVDSDFFADEKSPVFHTAELRDIYNEWLAEIKSNGILDDMINRWIGVPLPAQEDIPVFEFTGENGTLVVCDTGNFPPYAYLDANGNLAGFDYELVSLFAIYLGKNLDISLMTFDAIIPYVLSGRADMSACLHTITTERADALYFGMPTVVTQAVLIVPGDIEGIIDSGGGLIDWFRTGIQRNLITDNRWKLITNGLGVTMTISLASQFFGTLFACFVCYILTRRNKFVNGIGRFFCGLIDGLPIVVILLIAYYIVFGSTQISNVFVAITAFTVIMGSNIAQGLKGAIDTVDTVEIEAARSIGFTAFRAFLLVTLPQAVRRAMPGYTKGFVELVKVTAVVGFIAIQDLTRAGDIIRSRTFDAYFPLLFVALIYLFITTLCVLLFKYIVKWMNKTEVHCP